ncbi:MAG: pyrroline-5-carboxylate reductase [Clostridia bacterium]|nr:pyrroline-5-carboxylate reductase [Clostridia bacterium]
MKLGFIGAGNMGSAIISGLLRQDSLPADDLYISRKHPELSADFAKQGVHVLANNCDLVRSCDGIVLAIKPVYTAQVLEEIHDVISGKLVISIVAGWTYDMLKAALPESTRFVRVMPNTPLAVGEGMSLLSSRCTCTEEEFAFAKAIFAAAGKVAVVEDHVYTPANGISGCGPAFVYEFIEAMADGGVRYGVPRALAYELAAQTLIGAAKMVLETGEHPGKLKDAVCSPGGTTIEGIYALEKGGMRAAVMDAVGATVEKTNKLAK